MRRYAFGFRWVKRWQANDFVPALIKFQNASQVRDANELASEMESIKHLTVEQLGDETLVYDQRSHMVYLLNPVASDVFSKWSKSDQCIESIVEGSELTETEIADVLALLNEHSLLAESPKQPDGNAFTRRSVVGTTALAGAAAVTYMVAPTPSQAASGPCCKFRISGSSWNSSSTQPTTTCDECQAIANDALAQAIAGDPTDMFTISAYSCTIEPTCSGSGGSSSSS